MVSESNKNRIRKMIVLCDELIAKCKNKTENDYDEFFKEFKDIDWNEVKGARNKIYHDYDVVNMSIIWDTLKDIPNFKTKLEELI